jgi:NAD(P)-dependent dehydrogenase (short-subunit alcohol dehydrogenase family)
MFELGLRGRRALVHGGAHGLGLACARALAAEGVRVALFDTDAAALSRAATELDALALPGDPSSREQIEGAVADAESALGGIDILVNAAPVEPAPAPLHEVADAEWERVASDHLLAYLRFMRAVTPGMRERGHGRILNLTGVAGRNPDPLRLPASTAAIAVLNLTKAVADEFAHHGVTINAVSPGVFEGDEALEDGGPGEQENGNGVEAEMVVGIPAGRAGTTEELADLMLFLASDRASYVTGASITIDGGRTRGI